MVSFVLFQRLISYQRERERNFHFLRPGFVIDLGRFSRQKIADLNFNLSFSKQRFRIKKNHEQNVPRARASKDGGSFLRFKFIYICIPCARDPLAARYEQPDAAIDFVLAHEPAHPFRSDSTSNIPPPSAPKSTPHPRGNSLLRNSSIRPFLRHLSSFNGRCLGRFESTGTRNREIGVKFLCSFLSLFVTVLFVSFGDNLNKGGAK